MIAPRTARSASALWGSVFSGEEEIMRPDYISPWRRVPRAPRPFLRPPDKARFGCIPGVCEPNRNAVRRDAGTVECRDDFCHGLIWGKGGWGKLRKPVNQAGAMVTAAVDQEIYCSPVSESGASILASFISSTRNSNSATNRFDSSSCCFSRCTGSSSSGMMETRSWAVTSP